MIYSVKTYNGEAEMLLLQCEELRGLDVMHIVVESPWTFTGKEKDLKFPEVMSRFNDFNIVYLVCENMPNTGDPWVNEKHQRNFSMSQLLSCANRTDTIIIADCDEVVSRAAVLKFENIVRNSPENNFAALRMDMFGYWLNCRQGVQSWDRARIMTFDYLSTRTPEEVRNSGFSLEMHNAGWHWSYLGGVERVMEKFNSFSHQEVNTPLLNNEAVLKYKIENGQSLWSSEPDDLWQFIQIDESFPEYLRNNLPTFKHVIKQ